MSDELDKAFDIVETVSEVTPKAEVKQPPKKVDGKDEVQDDYEYARSNLYLLVDKGQEAVNGALDLAMSSDHPRACLLYTSPSPRDKRQSRMPSSA